MGDLLPELARRLPKRPWKKIKATPPNSPVGSGSDPITAAALYPRWSDARTAPELMMKWSDLSKVPTAT